MKRFYIKSETFEEHDTEFDSNKTFGQNTTLSGNEMDTDNIEIGVEDVKPFEFIEVKMESVTDNSLTCGKCNEKFGSRGALQLHKINFHDKDIKCSISNATFTKQSSLNSHLLTHADKKTFSCPLCSSKFTRRDNLKTHLTIHTGEKPYKCSVCSKDFRLKFYLQQHLIGIHEIVATADLLQKQPTVPVIIDKKLHTVCEKCNIQFSSHENLSQHVCTIQDNVKIETVEEHDTKFTNRTFKAHLSTHAEKSEKKPFTCSLCSSKYTTIYHLKTHLLTIHNLDGISVASLLQAINIKTHKCKLCPLTFVTKKDLSLHMNSLHRETTSRPYKCNDCGACFTEKRHLNEHSTIHTGEKPYKCSICSRDFRLKSILNQHLLKVHKIVATADLVQKQPTVVPVIIVQKEQTVCKKCNVQFSSHENLGQHVCTIQDNVKIETFEEQDTEIDSNETFGQNTTLSGNEMDTDNIEIAVEDVKSFKITIEEVETESLLAEPDNSLTCGKCNKKFSSYGSLQKHILNHHRLNKCSICNAAFASKKILKTHLKTHKLNDIKTLACELCSFKCITHYQLINHLVNIHKLDKNSVHVAKLLQPSSFKDNPSYRTYVCKICDIKFTSNSHFQDHTQAFHQNFKPFKCKVCGEGFNTHSNLNSHSTIHCVEKPYKCSICSQDFRLMDSLRKHFRKAHYVDEQLKQPEARKTNLINVDNMSLLANSDNSNYQCDVCHKVCISLDELKEHKIVHNCSLAYFNCNKCCIFDIFENLEKHIATNHTEDSSFKCSVCNATFKSLQKFRTHVSYMHENTIEEPQNLMVIVSSDSINESVKCEICKQDFNNRTSLKCHFNKMHTNNKDLKCDLCGKTYWRDGILQRHCDNFHKTANLTSGLQHSPPKPQLRQYVAKYKVRQPDCKLTASSLPEMWVTKVKPCFVRLDRGEVTRYLSRLDKREVTEERGSPIEGLPPTLATPAPPVRDDPRHPCGAVSVTSDLLLGAATSTLENVRQQENYSKRESYVEPNFVLDDCKLNSDNANLSSNHSYTNGNEGVNQNLENFEEMFIKTEPIVLEMSDIVDPLSVCTVNNDREISNDVNMEQSLKEGLSQINDHDNNIFQNDNKIVRKESNTSINISSDKETSTYKLRCIYCDVRCSAASELEIHMKKDHNITCKIPYVFENELNM